MAHITAWVRWLTWRRIGAATIAVLVGALWVNVLTSQVHQARQVDRTRVQLAASQQDASALRVSLQQVATDLNTAIAQIKAFGQTPTVAAPSPEAVRGEPGAVGATGPPGKDGARGLPGEQGVPGIQGVPGDVGPRGAQGIQGNQGPVGDTGATGPAGPPGKDGATGPQGPAGLPGSTPNIVSITIGGVTYTCTPGPSPVCT